MTAYQFTCIAPIAALFLLGGVVAAYLEWKGWWNL